MQSLSARWFLTVLPSEWSAAAYREVFSLPLAASSLRNSLFYAGCSAALDVVLGTAIALLLVRERFRGRSLLDALAMLPLALPGLVTAFAYLAAFAHGPFPAGWAGANGAWLLLFDPRRNPAFLLVVAYALHRLPYLVRAACAGLEQSSPDLERASANLGAGPWRTALRITAPLLAANLIGGTLLAFSFGLLDVSSGMVLGAGEPLLSAHQGDLLPAGPDYPDRPPRWPAPWGRRRCSSWAERSSSPPGCWDERRAMLFRA